MGIEPKRSLRMGFSVIVALVGMAVLTSAGVFEIVAAGAVVEIEVEAFHDGLGSRIRLDLPDGRNFTQFLHHWKP